MEQKVTLKVEFVLDLEMLDGRGFDSQDAGELQDLLAMYVEEALYNSDHGLATNAIREHMSINAKKVKYKVLDA
jgi:hypothetical protein